MAEKLVSELRNDGYRWWQLWASDDGKLFIAYDSELEDWSGRHVAGGPEWWPFDEAEAHLPAEVWAKALQQRATLGTLQTPHI
jgi:hypothetical protein